MHVDRLVAQLVHTRCHLLLQSLVLPLVLFQLCLQLQQLHTQVFRNACSLLVSLLLKLLNSLKVIFILLHAQFKLLESELESVLVFLLLFDFLFSLFRLLHCLDLLFKQLLSLGCKLQILPPELFIHSFQLNEFCLFDSLTLETCFGSWRRSNSCLSFLFFLKDVELVFQRVYFFLESVSCQV